MLNYIVLYLNICMNKLILIRKSISTFKQILDVQYTCRIIERILNGHLETPIAGYIPVIGVIGAGLLIGLTATLSHRIWTSSSAIAMGVLVQLIRLLNDA